MSNKYYLTFIISGGIVILDQITKFLVDLNMSLHQSIEIIPNFFHLTYIRNTGAAFGLLAGDPTLGRIIFFTLFSFLAIGCLIYLLKNLRPGAKTAFISLSLILGGAIGNLIDRLRWGEIIDFLDLHWYNWHWPAFNIADSSITIGVIFLFYQIMRKRL